MSFNRQIGLQDLALSPIGLQDLPLGQIGLQDLVLSPIGLQDLALCPIGLQDLAPNDLWDVDDIHYPFIPRSDSSTNDHSYDDQLSSVASSDSHLYLDTGDGTSDDLDVRKTLNSKIKEKMRIEGKEHTSLFTNTGVEELTPDDETKQKQRLERNRQAARKSRLKKKECDSKVLKENEVLKLENQDLKNEMQRLRSSYDLYESFLMSHKCSSRSIIVQQDHGDDVCQATGGRHIHGPDVEEPRKDQPLFSNDKDMHKLVKNLYEMSVSLKVSPQKPQELQEIISSLQEQQASQREQESSVQEMDCSVQEESSVQESESSLALIPVQGEQSMLATSGSIYDGNLHGHSNFIEEQRNSEMIVANYSSEVQGSYNINTNYSEAQYKPNPAALQDTRFSLSVRRPPATYNGTSVWSTGVDDQSDEMEALMEVYKIVKPPPEKKSRLE